MNRKNQFATNEEKFEWQKKVILNYIERIEKITNLRFEETHPDLDDEIIKYTKSARQYAKKRNSVINRLRVEFRMVINEEGLFELVTCPRCKGIGKESAFKCAICEGLGKHTKKELMKNCETYKRVCNANGIVFEIPEEFRWRN